MKTIYHLTLAADMHPIEKKFDVSNSATSEWHHCADTLEALVAFATHILAKTPDYGAVKCVKIQVTRFIDFEDEGFYTWEGDSEVEPTEINILVHDVNDSENLYNLILNRVQNFSFRSTPIMDRVHYDENGNEWIQENIVFE